MKLAVGAFEVLNSTEMLWGIRKTSLNRRFLLFLLLPDDVRRKGEDGLCQFGPGLFACKAIPINNLKKD